MFKTASPSGIVALALSGGLCALFVLPADPPDPPVAAPAGPTSYLPVDAAEPFTAVRDRLANGAMASADGPIKTMPLRGIKDCPPYLHDGLLLTLEDTVEFFNLVLERRLSAQEKADLVAFLRQL